MAWNLKKLIVLNNLGSLITSNNDIKEEIRSWIAAGSR